MASAAVTDILDHEARLVSPLTGIVRKLHRVHKDATEPALPFVWRAEISNHRFLSGEGDHIVIAAGKGLDHDTARRGALGEAVERYCALRPPPGECLVSARNALEGPALDPKLLVLHSDEQLETLPYDRYSPDEPIAWIPGICLNDGVETWIPAHAVYLVPPADTPVFFQATSNGVAAGGDQERARLGAILELIERDAFLAAWYHGLPGRPIDISSHPDRGIAAIADAYRRRGVAIEAYLLPTDHGIPVVAALAIGKDEKDPAVVVGLGAGRLADAVRSAVTEVGQVRPAIRMKLREPKTIERRSELVADPSMVTELEDHDLLYTDWSMLPAFDIWRSSADNPVAIEDEPAANFSLDRVVAALMAAGSRTHVCDITTPDVRSLGIHVVRAFVEDFQPIHFGEAEFRKRGTRFYDLPRRLGLGPAGGGLNPLPHPLS